MSSSGQFSVADAPDRPHRPLSTCWVCGASLWKDFCEDSFDLAGVAAHASERLAAPLTCFLVGRAGMAPDEALARANRMVGEA